MRVGFCPSCGSQLVENAKFCSQCGNPVTGINKEEKFESKLPVETACALESNNTNSEPNPLYTIKIGKYDLQVAESVIEYNKVRSHFVDYAEKSQHSFESFCDKEVHDFDGLYSKALPDFLNRAADAVQFTVSLLEQYGLSIQSDKFLMFAEDSLHFDTYLKEYIDIAEQLENFAEQLCNYRANNRSRNIQWQGGGFGLTGALEGALMAGALNIATDAVRGIGHSIVNSADRARLKKVQIELYKAINHKAHLSKSLFDVCMSLFNPAVDLLEKKEIIVHPPFDIASGIDAITEAFDLMNQQKEPSDKDYEKALRLTLQGMPYDPYFLLSYLTLYKIPLIKKKDLLNLVRFFGMEDKFKAKITADYESEALANFALMSEETVEDIDKKIAKADKLKNTLCYPNISIQTLKAKRRKLVNKAKEEEARKEKELQLKKENNSRFQIIKGLPEETLEQLQVKQKELEVLCTTPAIKKEINRVASKLKRVSEQKREEIEHTDFLAAFSNANLNMSDIAKRLVKNSVFQELHIKLTRNLNQTKELIKRAYFQGNERYISSKENLAACPIILQDMRKGSTLYTQTEVPIILVRANGGEGNGWMLISNQKLYIKGNSKNDPPYVISLNKIRSISATKRTAPMGGVFWEISVDGAASFEIFEDSFLKHLSIEKLIQIFYFIINYCLFLAATDGQHIESLSLDILNAADIPLKKIESDYQFSSQADINKIKQEIEQAEASIASHNEGAILENITQENMRYCYAIEKHYRDLVRDADPDDGKDHFEQVKSIIMNIHQKSNVHPFFKYLEAHLWMEYYERNNKNVSNYVAQICQLSDRGLPAAMALKGFWASREYKNLGNMVDEGISLLKRASSSDEPTAMAWLGSYYRRGSFGLPVDLGKANELLTRAAAYGHPYAIKELELLDKEGVGTPYTNKSKSSGCFITSAVCRSFYKPDDCYELTTFRAFRDNWLCKQPDGKELIKEYYQIAPSIVSIIDSQPNCALIYLSIWEKYLMPCLRNIELGQLEKCKTLYVAMVNNLKKQYI